MKTTFVALGFLMMVAVSCKKDDPTPPPTAVDLVTSATWKIDTIGIDTDDDGAIDTALPFGLQPCDYDNTLTFSSDSTGLFSYGAVKCDDSEPDGEPLTWYLKDNDSVIFIEGNIVNLQGDVDIITLSNTSFVLSKPVQGFSGNLIVSLMK